MHLITSTRLRTNYYLWVLRLYCWTIINEANWPFTTSSPRRGSKITVQAYGGRVSSRLTSFTPNNHPPASHTGTIQAHRPQPGVYWMYVYHVLKGGSINWWDRFQIYRVSKYPISASCLIPIYYDRWTGISQVYTECIKYCMYIVFNMKECRLIKVPIWCDVCLIFVRKKFLGPYAKRLQTSLLAAIHSLMSQTFAKQFYFDAIKIRYDLKIHV